MRIDNTPKGSGYFGPLPHASGGISTELSFDFDVDGKNILAPLLVPYLSKQEIDHLLSGKPPTTAIYDKAKTHAFERMKAGKSVWALPDEQFPLPAPITISPLQDILTK